MLVTRILNQTTRGQTDITTCSHIAEIETQFCCFQWSMWIILISLQTPWTKSLGCLDANITLSKRALMQVRFRSNHYSANQTCTWVLWINNTHRLVDTKASKLDHLWKATQHGTDIIPILPKVNHSSGFCNIYSHFSVYSTKWHIVYSLWQRQRCNMFSIYCFHLSVLPTKHRPSHQNLTSFSSYVLYVPK